VSDSHGFFGLTFVSESIRFDLLSVNLCFALGAD